MYENITVPIYYRSTKTFQRFLEKENASWNLRVLERVLGFVENKYFDGTCFVIRIVTVRLKRS